MIRYTAVALSVVIALLVLLAAAWWVAAPGGTLDHWAEPSVSRISAKLASRISASL